MIKFKTIQADKKVRSSKYITHIQDVINKNAGICGRKLSWDATKSNFRVELDPSNQITFKEKDLCLKCLVAVGAIEKVSAKKVTDKSVISDSLPSTNRIETTYNVLVDLNLKSNTIKKGSVVKDYEIF
tara:strand:+ start:318 stop:701 length:384 start_codon:yes stop_codon:yes gene_type:complete